MLKTIKLKCILTVFSIKELKAIESIARKLKIKQEIHLPIDAYFGREGFLKHELPRFFKELKKYKYIKLTGIYAHFANIGSIRLNKCSFGQANNFTHAKKQINKYTQAIKLANKFGFNKLQTHISATAGLLVYEKGKGVHPLIRLGIGVYGMWPSKYIKFSYKNKIELKPVLSWKTKIAQIKILPTGSTIGYGLTYTTSVSTKIALIPQGYADGLDRGLSNKGEVLISGTKCKILGRVTMNMFVVNVSHLSNVKVEDEVVIIGSQGNEQITVEEIAKKIDTINYEITTRLSSFLSRIIV